MICTYFIYLSVNDSQIGLSYQIWHVNMFNIQKRIMIIFPRPF